MVGPRISVSIFGIRTVIGAVDAILAALILFGVLRERVDPPVTPILIAAGGLALVGLCFAVSLASERLRLRLGRVGPSALPLTISIPTAYGPTLTEARSSVRAARAGLAGMVIDAAIGLIAVSIFLLVHSSDKRLSDLATVAAIAIGGSAGLRFLAAPALNGGRVMRWMLGFTLDDDEDAVRGTRLLGYAIAVVLFITGIVLLASEGEAGFWGVALAAVGIDVGVLSALATRQTDWLKSAGDRTIGQLLDSPHATVTVTSPLDEMVSVLTVDGPAAIAVVRDRSGNAVGIMQFQQMRAGVGHRKDGLTIGDVMIPLIDLPEADAETTLLEAAERLMTSRRPALRFESAPGKTMIVTARDIGLPR